MSTGRILAHDLSRELTAQETAYVSGGANVITVITVGSKGPGPGCDVGDICSDVTGACIYTEPTC